MSEERNAVVKFVEGRKTYFVAATILVCGILEQYGVNVPLYVWAALAAFGLGFLRMGIQKGT